MGGVVFEDGSTTSPKEFDISHTDGKCPTGFQDFFRRIDHHKQELDLSVVVAMEGFNGYARPLDRMIQQHGYTLYNVNNLKPAGRTFLSFAPENKCCTRAVCHIT